MALSMTGYGRAQRENAGWFCTVEIKSVNHRFLDVTVRTPRLYICLEEPVKALVSQEISRGKADVFVTLEPQSAPDVQVALNKSVAEGYLTAARTLMSAYMLPDDFGVAELLRMPDVLTLEKREADLDALTALTLQTAREACATLVLARKREGARLREDLLARLDDMESLTARVESRWPQVVGKYREKLEARMRETLGGTDLEPQRILAEAALFADRTAVNEEIVRLKAHMDAARALLDSAAPMGRKLDFLVQETLREINTIGSKGSDLDMSMLVVDLKAELEKIREQVQNVE